MSKKITIEAPEGLEFTGECECQVFFFGRDGDGKRIEEKAFFLPLRPQEDPYAPLKAQYALDVEACKGIDGLEPWELWQIEYGDGVWRKLISQEELLTNSFIEHCRRHPHADTMIDYYRCSHADKARWEFCVNKEWHKVYTEPEWFESTQYRLSPDPFYIGKYEVPPPVTTPLNTGDRYYFFTLSSEFSVDWRNWEDVDFDFEMLKNNRIRMTREDAEKCHEALIKTIQGR